MLDVVGLVFFYSYGIPVFLINVRIIYVLYAKKHLFTSTYYRLFFYAALNDTFLWILNNFLVRLPAYAPLYNLFYSNFNEFTRLFAVPMFLMFFCSYSINCLTFLLSLQRLTAVWMYTLHETVNTITNFLIKIYFSCGGVFINTRWHCLQLAV